MNKNVFRPGGLSLTKKSADTIGLNNRSSVLDIGCGPGGSLAFFSKEYGCRVSGVDISEKAVMNARHEVPHADIRIADAASLPFDDSMFDAVFMECTLTLFAEPEKAIKESFRVLKTGGWLVISSITKEGPELMNNGGTDTGKLTGLLKDTGFSSISVEDEKYELVQFIADIIFEYGSLNEYLKDAESRLGGAVLKCGTDRKNISYAVIRCVKPQRPLFPEISK